MDQLHNSIRLTQYITNNTVFIPRELVQGVHAEFAIAAGSRQEVTVITKKTGGMITVIESADQVKKMLMQK